MPVADWLPNPTVGHRYEVIVPLDPERALAHALSTPVAPDRLVRTLFRLRGLDHRGSIENFGSNPPFVELKRSRTEWVAGVAAAVWRPGDRGPSGPQLRDPEDWAGWDAPGTVRAVMTLIARGDRGGSSSLLVTETAAQPSDPSAARAFGLYWLFVGPFSRLIRKRWLRAIKKRAHAVGAR